jgi:hypothetical protein
VEYLLKGIDVFMNDETLFHLDYCLQPIVVSQTIDSGEKPA